MGNKMVTNVEAPEEIWLHIISYLMDDLKSLCNFSVVSKLMNKYCNDDLLWHNICERYKNYKNIKYIKNMIKLDWRSAFIYIQDKPIKISGIEWQTDSKKEIITFKLMGNGKCFISEINSSKMIQITEFNSPVYQSMNNLNIIMKHIPFTSDHMKFNFIKNERKKLESVKIADISIYSPFILLLSEDDKIFEFLITPEWVSNYGDYKIPTEVVLPLENYRIIKINCTMIANFAIAKYGKKTKVFIWTFIEGQRFGPVLIKPLCDIDIVDIGRCNTNITEFITIENNIEKIIAIKNMEIYTYLFGDSFDVVTL